jgi:hypothetical protein
MIRSRKMKWAGHVARTKEEKYMPREQEGEESLED